MNDDKDIKDKENQTVDDDRESSESITIPIIYQDEHILVVHKPAFMMVHPWRGGPRKEKPLMNHLKEQTGLWLYPVHRLDRQTSGLVLFALESKHVTFFKDRWHSNEVEKKYYTLASGIIEKPGEFRNQLKTQRGHKQDAHTIYSPVENFDHPEFPTTLCDVSIKTGRKHQIRRHFSRHMKNIIGDTRYGKGPINDFFREKLELRRLFLHSYFLKIPHPVHNELMNFEIDMASELTVVLNKLRSGID